MIAGTIVIASASSRTHGNDSQMDTASQPTASVWAATNLTATGTYGRRPGCGSVRAASPAAGC